MSIFVRKYTQSDLPFMIEIWNEVVLAGNAFPQTEPLDFYAAQDFFAEQSFSAVAECDGKVVGLYILHPNNIGRCGHISNSSYAVKSNARGQGIGEALVKHSLTTAKELGFKILQFNAVVKSNHNAIKLYNKLGFVELGVIPGGFKMNDGTFEDIISFYHTL